jgi:hypothetical protein
MAKEAIKVSSEVNPLDAYKKAVADMERTKEECAAKLKAEQAELIQKVKEIDEILGTNSFGGAKVEKKGSRDDIKTPLFALIQQKASPIKDLAAKLTQFKAAKVKMTIARFVKNKQLLNNEGVISINPKAPIAKRGRKKAA